MKRGRIQRRYRFYDRRPRESAAEKRFNDRCQQWYSGGLLFRLIEILKGGAK